MPIKLIVERERQITEITWGRAPTVIERICLSLSTVLFIAHLPEKNCTLYFFGICTLICNSDTCCSGISEGALNIRSLAF